MGTKISGLPAVAGVVDTHEFAIVRQKANYRGTALEIKDRILRPGNVGSGPIAPNSITANELANAVDGVTKRFNADMVDGQDASDLFGGKVPLGGMLWWSGAVGAIPAGWSLCDGSNGTPNLVDRFIVGAGNEYVVGNNGGEDTVDTSHTHSHSDGVNKLSVNLTGAHSHTPSETAKIKVDTHVTVWDWSETHSSTVEGDHTHAWKGATASGGNAAEENRPPYWALCIIQRTG